jgi:RNA-binding protein NOB1
MEDHREEPTAPPGPCWSTIVKSQPPPKPKHEPSPTSNQVFVDNCKSSKGIAVAVVDANALIEGGSDKLTHSADKFVTVPEVMAEVRDPTSRHRLSFLLPSSLHSMDPSPDSLNKGNSRKISFSRETNMLFLMLFLYCIVL